METAADAILEHVLSLLHWLGGRRLSDGADKLVAADHGVTGWDGIDLLEKLEAEYDVDLRPFVEARATQEKGWVRTYTTYKDVTPRELADHIADLVRAKTA